MRSICLYFQVHQPYRLRTFRFFDIGVDSNYYDEYQNRYIVRRIAEKSYLPTNELIYELIKIHGGAFKVTFSISGLALEQFEKYTPEVISSFQKLASTGCVEFLGETYGHSLASLRNPDEFRRQVLMHSQKTEELFGQKPRSFRNTELIYSDEIGQMASALGFSVMLAEGAKHVLGWRSPNFLYYNALNPKLKILMRNFRLSDDIGFRFSNKAWSEWPLTAEKYVGWLNAFDEKEQIVNIFLDYETFGEHQWKETGIFEFLRALPAEVLKKSDYRFVTPIEAANLYQPVAPIHVPYPTSWADEERDLTAWLGNELQDEAVGSLYALAPKVYHCDDPKIWNDWMYLQASDHFYYMCTKWFSDGEVHKYFNPYPSPYEAYINFMNVLSDFILRVENNSAGKEKFEGWPSMKSILDFESTPRKSKSFEPKAAPIKKFKKNRKKSLDDLNDLKTRDLKKGLKTTDNELLARVIHKASAPLTEKILSLMSKKQRTEVEILVSEIKKVTAKALQEALEEIIKNSQ